MKHLLLLVLLSGWACTLTAQKSMKTYSTEWKTVDSLWQKKGLPESALKEVRKIYDAATKEGNSVQQVKALLYMGQLTEINTEDADAKQIAFLEKKLGSAKEPARSLLHSMLGTAYWQYYQENRWELEDRTATLGKGDDILSWSAEDLKAAITKHLQASLENRGFLQGEKLDAYDPIILKGTASSRALRPTLYDLLCHAALSYYEREDEDGMPRVYVEKEGPAGKPGQDAEDGREELWKDNVIFAPAAAFAAHRFAVGDSSDVSARALLLYQELTRFHQADTRPDALIDLEIARLQFAKSRSTREDASFLYMKALSFLEKAYPTNPAIAQAAYLRIQEQYRDESSVTSEGKPIYEPGLRSALAAECRRISATWPESEGDLNAARFLQQLEKREFSLQAEKVNIPGKPFRMLVSYRNISQLHYRIIPLTEELRSITRERWNDQYWTTMIAQKPLRAATQRLPVTEDMRNHSVEVKVDALEPGAYILLASADAGFSMTKNPLALQYFYVSSIAYVQHDDDFFVVDRDSGKPLAQASVTVMQQVYDYNKRAYVTMQRSSLSTGPDGFFRLPSSDLENRQIRLDIRHQKDRLYIDDPVNVYRYRDEDPEKAGREAYEKKHRRVFLFADRSIYRPGQTVYFKGLVMTRDFDTRRYKIVPGFSTVIRLQDTEDEDIDSLAVRTNEFGSYKGSFRIPTTVMTGSFSLEDDDNDGRVSLQVEEYKRPTFYIQYEPVKGVVRVQDTVRVHGTVMAYAGNALNGSKVRYRVTREARFPYPWMARIFPYHFRPPVEIAQGTVTTDASGRFEIPFKAIPDPTVDRKSLPVFHYRVSVDATDMSGETRSEETTVQVGYHVLDLQAIARNNGVVPNMSDASLELTARNLPGEPLSQAVEISVYPALAPKRLIRPRYWPAPDTVVMPEAEFLRDFPNDEYRKELEKENWARGAAIFQKKDTIRNGSMRLQVPLKQQAPGWYLVEARAVDPFGQEINTQTWLHHEADENGTNALPHYLNAELLSPIPYTALRGTGPLSPNSFEPGSRATLRLSTTVPELWVIRQSDRAGKPSPLPQEGKIGNPKKAVAMEDPGHPYQVFEIKAGTQVYATDIKEEDRGGLGLYHVTVKHNRVFTTENIVDVPWTTKELDVSLTTFRGKTEPGSQESWTVQVSGKKGEKWAAEILASMYDASLDQFLPHAWQKPDIHPRYPANLQKSGIQGWTGTWNFQSQPSENRGYPDSAIKWIEKKYDLLLWDQQEGRVMPLNNLRTHVLYEMAAAPMADSTARADDQNKLAGKATGVAVRNEEGAPGAAAVIAARVQAESPALQGQGSPLGRLRTDFRETAFFFPDLRTDSAGNVRFTFTMPDALTTWKAQILAHTRDLALGYAVQQIVTQKELMVQPNAPRFLREGDQLVFPARITNMGEKEVSGQAELQVLDTETGQVVDGLFNNLFPVQYFTVAPKQGAVVQFPLQVPGNFSKPVTYRIIAKTKQHSDGEEQSLPVLSNRILLTESIPFVQKGSGTKTYSFGKLKQSAQSPTLTHHALTVELSTNPAWYAVQALPYLTGYPYDCSEQVFNRFYGNALAAHIANSKPAMKTFYQAWVKEDAAGKKSLRSKLEQNPELKSIILQETPWVMDAKQQDEQLKQIAVLFDDERLSKDMEAAIGQLEKAQSPNGGFMWFPGGPDDRYITQYIMAGIGKLRKTGAAPQRYRERLDAIAMKALSYMHARIREDYDALKKKKADLQKQQIGYTQIQYLYAISFFQGGKTEAVNLQAITYYHQQAQQFWTGQPRQLQAMIALALWRSKDGKTPASILASLKERAIKNESLGMYWKRGSSPWYWQEADLESQALLIEAFTEITKDESSIAAMKQWLLTQKQTSHWESTRATADACYALLLRGSDWLSSNMQANVSLGGVKTIDWKNDKSIEAGTGYRKSVIPGSEVSAGMGDLRVTLSDPSGKSAGVPAWGAAYWQYFEQLEHVASAGGPLSVRKKLYRSINTAKGPVLEPLQDGESFRVGDKLVVRLEIRADRDMEYVHLKDMRASGTEPVNVLSGYKWQGVLGYYESTRDAATNFFFDRINRGTYVFEYPVFVSQEGSFSTGPAIIQCMYAPEFTGHSEGFRIKVN